MHTTPELRQWAQGRRKTALAFYWLNYFMNTIVYIDGFSLYYRALRPNPTYKWLDLSKLCQNLLPGHTITSIKYFTARIKANANDPSQQARQAVCLRALATIPNLQIIFGKFQTFVEYKPLAKGAGYGLVRVIDTEEKESDVNLASHLIHDGHMNRYDAAVVLSNDSDLLSPVNIVRNEIGKMVGVISPAEHPCRSLISASSFFKKIHVGVMGISQFPDVLRDTHGSFHKPIEWGYVPAVLPVTASL